MNIDPDDMQDLFRLLDQDMSGTVLSKLTRYRWCHGITGVTGSNGSTGSSAQAGASSEPSSPNAKQGCHGSWLLSVPAVYQQSNSSVSDTLYQRRTELPVNL